MRIRAAEAVGEFVGVRDPGHGGAVVEQGGDRARVLGFDGGHVEVGRGSGADAFAGHSEEVLHRNRQPAEGSRARRRHQRRANLAPHCLIARCPGTEVCVGALPARGCPPPDLGLQSARAVGATILGQDDGGVVGNLAHMDGGDRTHRGTVGARGPELGNRVVTQQNCDGIGTHGLFVIPEQVVEDGDIVGHERGLVSPELLHESGIGVWHEIG